MYRPTTISNTNPTVNEDYSSGYRAGNYWWDTATETLYILEDDTTGAASWVEISSTSDIVDWQDWTPTFGWTPAAPAAPTYVARYQTVGNKIGFFFDLQGTNDSGSTITAVSMTPPVTIKDVNAIIAFSAGENASATTSPTRVVLGLIDAESASNRKIHVASLSINNTADYRITGEGFYEITT